MATPEVTINTNTNLSTKIDCGMAQPVGLMLLDNFIPANTGISLLISNDGITFFNMEDGAGNILKVVAGAPPCYVPLTPIQMVGVRYLQLSLNTNVNGNSVVNIVTRNL